MVALKFYMDGSEQRRRSLNLFAIGAYDTVWARIEPEWKAILDLEGADYFHATDFFANPPRGIFKGWDLPKRIRLIEPLLAVLRPHQDSPFFAGFSCAILLKDHAEVSSVKRLPSPARLCSRIVVYNLHDWFASVPDIKLTTMDLWFDQGEKFLNHVVRDWEKGKKTKGPFIGWKLVKTCAPADSRQVIPLQVADLYAWSCSRILNAGNQPMSSIPVDPLATAARAISSCPMRLRAVIKKQDLLSTEYSASPLIWCPPFEHE